MLNSVIDFEESKIDGRLIPKRGIHEQLDDLKQTYAGIESLLVSSIIALVTWLLTLASVQTEIGVEELQHYPSISTLKIVYFPQIGYEV